MRVALIGAGRIGAMHARNLVDCAGVTELLVADVDTARAAEVARSVGAAPSPTIDAAMDGAEAVVIAAATDAHAELIRATADRRLPTFCEKPIAKDLAESVAVVEHVERAGIPLQLGFQRRFDPGYLEARRLIASGELGTIYAVALHGHDPEPPHEAYIPTSGGIFRDFSVHDFDIVRWLVGADVEEIYAMGSVRGFDVFAKYGDVDTAVASLRMTNGVLATLMTTRHDPLGYDIRAEVYGSRDSVVVGLGPRSPFRSAEPGVPAPAGPAWPNFFDRFPEAYRAELDAFLSVAAGNAPSPCTGRDGIAALRTAIAADRSRREQRPVLVTEI
ncbi:MAG: Gfo/Idh/MocA family oxidoreductase [Chloroflexi bacterium]|nr:Gfo/Idh/MocA family oxidoreductase [Chloroflexota bacterium]